MGQPILQRVLAPAAIAAASFALTPTSTTAAGPQAQEASQLDALAMQMALGDRPDTLTQVAGRLREARAAWDGQGAIDPAIAAALEAELALAARAQPTPYLWKEALAGIDMTEAAPPLAAAMAWQRRDTRELSMLTQWQFVGPFDNERGRGMTRPTPPEEEPALEVYPGKVRDVRWRQAPKSGHDGILYIGNLVNPANQVCVVARTWIKSDEARPATLLVSASEELRVWWNGEPVYEALGIHDFGIDGHAVSVGLVQGWNEIALKIGAQDEKPVFAARLVDDQTGAPLAVGMSSAAPEGVEPLPMGDPGRKLAKNRNQVTLAPGGRAFYGRKVDPSSVTARAVLAARSRSLPRKSRPGYADAAGVYAATPESMAATVMLLDTMRIPGALDVEEDVNPWLDALNESIERHGPLPQFMSWYAAFTAESQGLPERALDLTEEALKVHPDSVLSRIDQTVYLSAMSQDSLAKRAAAKLAMDPAMERWPDECMGLRSYFSPQEKEHVHLVDIAAAAGNVSAKSYLRTVAEMKAGALDISAIVAFTREQLEERFYDVGLRMSTGRRLLAAGAEEEALEMFNSALELSPESATLLSWRGRTLLAMGDSAGAIADIAMSCEYEPSNADELRFLEYLRTTAGGAGAQTSTDDFHERFSEPLEAIVQRHPAKEGMTDGAADAPREVLLNRRVVKVGADGKARRYQRTVERVLSDAGVRQLDRRNFRSFPRTEDLRVLSVRVLHADGTIEEGQTGRGPRLSIDLPPLEIGDVVDIEWRRDDLVTSIFGNYFGLNAAFSQEPSLETREADITVLEAPELRLYYHLAGETDQPVNKAAVTLEDGTVARSWSTADLTPRRSENLEPPAREHTLRLQASTYPDWESFGNWWWNLIREEIAVSPEMSAKVAEITRDKETRLDKLRAVYDFVVTDVRYNAWEFGVHGYQPYSAPVILSRRFGDCKDKAILLRAMLSEVGIEAWPVLIQSENRRFEEDLELPLVAHFNHCIAHVPAQEGIPEMFLDGTARLHPLEVLPDSDAGAKVLTVRSDGAEQMRIPFATAEANTQSEMIEVDLSKEGAPRAVYRQSPKGRWDPQLRYRFATDDAQQAEAAEALMTARFGPLKGDVTAMHPDYEDLDSPIILDLEAQVERVGSRTETGLELPTSFAPFRLEQSLASESERTTDVLLDVPWTIQRQIRFLLPEATTEIRLPENVEFETPDLRYRRTFVEGLLREVICVEVLELRTHRIPVERYAAFRDAARRVDAAQRRNIFVEVPQ